MPDDESDLLNHDRPDEQLDRLLADGLVQVPAGFADTVMQRIAADEATTASVVVQPATAEPVSHWEWLALVGAGVLGVSQLASFVLAAWVTVAAG